MDTRITKVWQFLVNNHFPVASEICCSLSVRGKRWPFHTAIKGKCSLALYMCSPRGESVSPLQDQCHSGRQGEAKAASTPLLASVLKFMTCRTSTACHRSHGAGWEFSWWQDGCHQWRSGHTLLHCGSFRSFKFLIPCSVIYSPASFKKLISGRSGLFYYACILSLR